MRTIQVDEDLYRLIQSLAIPFEEHEPAETLNRVLRGLLGNARQSAPQEVATFSPVSPEAEARERNYNADLKKLVEEGLIQDGQALYLTDSSDNKVAGFEATVVAAENKLMWSGVLFSMSALAQKGFNVQYSVRGPAYWCTEDGPSIQQIWEARLRKKGLMK